MPPGGLSLSALPITPPSVYFIEPILGAWESCLATANPLCRRYPKSKKTEGLVLENDVLDERKRFDQLFAIDYLQTMKAGYLDVGKLHMYYEIHGRGDPLLMLHGEFAATGMFSLVTPQLRRTRRVILVDQKYKVTVVRVISTVPSVSSKWRKIRLPFSSNFLLRKSTFLVTAEGVQLRFNSLSSVPTW